MAKNLKQLREKAATKGPSVKLKEIIPPADNTVATQRFIKKHVVAHHEDPAGNGDDVYNASNIKPVKRSPDHGYDPGEDEKVYEETIQEKTLTPAEKAKREEIVLSMKKKNPKMPLGQLYAIATAQAIKVAEETETSVNEMKFSLKFSNPFKKPLDLTPDMQDPEQKKNLERLNAAMSRRPLTGNPREVMDKDLKRMRDNAAARGNPAEQVLTNLYNTLNEENRKAMLKLMESEEGFIKLVEFAVEKGID